jgi:Tfp pilus assembly protein PilX
MLVMKPRPARRERGDVPGWVLITVMTAGLVVAIWALAADQLKAMLEQALESVSNK